MFQKNSKINIRMDMEIRESFHPIQLSFPRNTKKRKHALQPLKCKSQTFLRNFEECLEVGLVVSEVVESQEVFQDPGAASALLGDTDLRSDSSLIPVTGQTQVCSYILILDQRGIPTHWSLQAEPSWRWVEPV